MANNPIGRVLGLGPEGLMDWLLTLAEPETRFCPGGVSIRMKRGCVLVEWCKANGVRDGAIACHYTNRTIFKLIPRPRETLHQTPAWAQYVMEHFDRSDGKVSSVINILKESGYISSYYWARKMPVYRPVAVEMLDYRVHSNVGELLR